MGLSTPIYPIRFHDVNEWFAYAGLMSRPPTPKLTSDHLADIGLFGGLSKETLEPLASSLPTSRIEAGALVVEEGDLSTQMFVVVAGVLATVAVAATSVPAFRASRLDPMRVLREE